MPRYLKVWTQSSLTSPRNMSAANLRHPGPILVHEDLLWVLNAYRVCALEFITVTVCACSATDGWLVKVILLRLLSMKTVSAYLVGLTLRLFTSDHDSTLINSDCQLLALTAEMMMCHQLGLHPDLCGRAYSFLVAHTSIQGGLLQRGKSGDRLEAR